MVVGESILDGANVGQAKDSGAVVRASKAHFLELVAILSETMPGDIMKGIVFVAIASANVEIVRRMDLSTAFAASLDVPPDAMRQPVSVYALSKSLGLPYETTRRHVGSLIDEGLCVRVGERGGVIVPADVYSATRFDALRRRHLASARKFATAMGG